MSRATSREWDRSRWGWIRRQGWEPARGEGAWLVCGFWFGMSAGPSCSGTWRETRCFSSLEHAAAAAAAWVWDIHILLICCARERKNKPRLTFWLFFIWNPECSSKSKAKINRKFSISFIIVSSTMKSLLCFLDSIGSEKAHFNWMLTFWAPVGGLLPVFRFF